VFHEVYIEIVLVMRSLDVNKLMHYGESVSGYVSSWQAIDGHCWSSPKDHCISCHTIVTSFSGSNTGCTWLLIVIVSPFRAIKPETIRISIVRCGLNALCYYRREITSYSVNCVLKNLYVGR
jgi:hypothetical protein